MPNLAINNVVSKLPATPTVVVYTFVSIDNVTTNLNTPIFVS
jgi:hypothetical protein